ncbi:uncharacterized protein LOC128213996 [Mya arenaria]|uniref:uncharacterized protein LOC128213996 n=1 Tax=Mya arenaria TaxID=6604 RepID=UPI0022E88B97|nr:uncharacterized protein LOC128213996 [Mya arenaria]
MNSGTFNLESLNSQTYENKTYDGSSSYLFSETESKGFKKPRARYLYFGGAAVLLIVVVVAIVLGVTLGGKSGAEDSNVEGSRGEQAGGTESTATPTDTTPSFSSTSEHPEVPDWLKQSCPSTGTAPQCPWSKPPLIVVSLDGFRAEYLLRNLTPTIQKLRDCGVHTPYMRSVYPTLTFPNHYTIVTGLYPESHGIVGNSMYDFKYNETFFIGAKTTTNSHWWGGEPIWVTARKQGLKTASYFWVGSETNISGYQPDYWERYNGSIPYTSRIDKAMDWLSMPDNERPELIMLYFDEPDHQGHGTGPDSEEVNEMLGKVDSLIGYLMNSLLAKNMDNCVNLVVLADHGMASTACERKIALDTWLPEVDNMLVYSGTTGYIQPEYRRLGRDAILENEQVVSTETITSSLDCKSDKLRLFTKTNIPVRHHYANNYRIGDVVVDVQDTWMFSSTNDSWCLHGNHGYDNVYKSMHALFLAHGPGFKQQYSVDPFENIELYNVMAALLNITPAPNNGTSGSLDNILASPPPRPTEATHVLETCNDVDRQCDCQANYQPPSHSGESVYPWGEPSRHGGTTSCIFHGNNVSALYSTQLMTPVAVSFRLSREQVDTDSDATDCLTSCPSYENSVSNIVVSRLVDIEFISHNEAEAWWNKVPLFSGFRTGIWSYLWTVTKEYASTYGDIHVTTGPIYDHNNDGLADENVHNSTKFVDDAMHVQLPSHMYIILVKCTQNNTSAITCPDEHLAVSSFVLPQMNKTANCMTGRDYLINNAARVRDIEHLTGHQFFTSMDVPLGARLRTFLPLELWPFSLSSTTKQPQTTAQITTPTPTTKPHSTTPLPVWLEQPCPADNNPQCPWSAPPLIVVSLDGFRAEYLLRNLTPTMQKLRDCGVHTPYMRAAYPTLTFPNHYTIVTGLYPESHGIVGNSMYDSKHNGTFSISGSGKFDSYWWGGEPIWTTTQKHGKKAASFFWVGSEMNISGYQPDYWMPYDGSITYEARIDKAMEWLSMPDNERPELIMLYFDEPDHQGHGAGPDSEEVNTMLQRVDDLIAYLMGSLLSKKIDNCVNLILLADHGMQSTSCGRKVALNTWLPEVTDMLVYSGTTGYIHPAYHRLGSGSIVKNDQVVQTETIVESLQCKSANARVFSRKDIPVRHHYSNNDRIGEVVVDVHDSWLFEPKPTKSCLKGNHGYDNVYKSMHALFLAHGPGFKQQFTAEPFENIELYNVMTALLNITGAPNNGTSGSLDHMLTSPPDRSTEATRVHDICAAVNSTCDCRSNYQPASNTAPNVYPWGEPSRQGGTPTCIVHGINLSAIYDQQQMVPVVVSFSLSKKQVEGYHSDPDTCLQSCTEFTNTAKGIETVRLYDPAFLPGTENEAYAGWNKIPMYTGFKNGKWNYLWRLINENAVQSDEIHITTGPIYDHNYDGLADMSSHNNTMFVDESNSVPLPSHIYTILVKCTKTNTTLLDCHPEDLAVLSFVLPHVNETHNCLPDKEYLINNVARVRDIEHLTGQRFFTALDVPLSARLRTYLPLDLWSTPLITPWVDLPCQLPDDTTCPSGPKPLVLISLDGFRADYLQRGLTPTLKKLSECGVHAPFMRPVYPTVTFPNHYTIVTGLYPESHGIVNNDMVDEDIGQIFGITGANASDSRWWKAEPIWITAKKQGKRTAALYWPGADVDFTGEYADYWDSYQTSEKAGNPERLKQILDLINLPNGTRPDLIAVHFDQPDIAGHNGGPDSDDVNGQLETMDRIISEMMSALYEQSLHNCVNIIVLSDHGFAPSNCDQTVRIKDLYPDISNMLMFDEAVGQIYTRFGNHNKGNVRLLDKGSTVSEVLSNLTCKNDVMKVFTKDQLPKRLHYANSDRIGDIILDMKEEWLVYQNSKSYCDNGNHGWDNINKNMHALFLAHGPAFKDNFIAEPFENIEIYNLLSDILDITPLPNNGTDGSLDYMFKDGNSNNAFPDTLIDYGICLGHAQVQEEFFPSCGCASNTSNINITTDEGLLVNDISQITSPQNICILNQTGYITGFNSEFKAPSWIQTSTRKSQLSNKTTTCIINDTRVGHDPCSIELSSGIGFYPLTKYVSEHGSYLSSTVIPLYDEFYAGIYTFIHKLIADYDDRYGEISVSVGTVFDYNNDGLWEGIINETEYADVNQTQPLPSHIYFILTKCKDGHALSQCGIDLDVLPFIIPHLPKIPNCLNPGAYLKDNVARIRDIELLTGLTFMKSFERGTGARMKTFLPEEIWETILIQPWQDMPCPVEDMCQSDYRPLLLISLDGFRADYLLRNVTPTVSRLSQCGVRAPYMRSVYPTKTFPNHYSIVTGLYPESHGIIDNNMYDTEMMSRFSLGSKAASDPSWWKGDPLWLTAKRQGLRTATFFWPGSDVEINGSYPDIWRKYDGSVSYFARTQEVLSWMSLPKGERPDFVTLYFDEPDLAGHKYGPSNEKEIGAALKRVDDTLAYLMEGLVHRNLHNCVNLVIIADHGMSDVKCNQVLKMQYHVPNLDYSYLTSNFWVWDGAFGRIADTYKYNGTVRGPYPVDIPAPSDDIVANLTCASPHMNVFTKPIMPVRHHYTNNIRIDNIILDMDPGWQVTRYYVSSCTGGTHGYDNIYRSMEALFLAHGPAFKWNLTVDAFENIELYNMFSDILNITASPNNGTAGSLDHLLQNPRTHSTETFTPYVETSKFSTAEEYATITSGNPCFRNCISFTKEHMRTLCENVTSSNTNDKHIPFGQPELESVYFSKRKVVISHLPVATIGYDQDQDASFWVSQTFTNVRENISADSGCSLPDPNIFKNVSGSRICSTDDAVSTSTLLLGDQSGMFDFVSSTMAIMKTGFLNNVWTPLLTFLREAVVMQTEVNVVVGPAFDHNFDSLPDLISHNSTLMTPSHFYIVLSHCSGDSLSKDCQNKSISSYILPHTENITICKNFSMYMLENEARLRDVEILTGLSFLSDLSTSVKVQLKTRLPVSRVSTALGEN